MATPPLHRIDPHPRKRRRWPWVILGVAALLVIIGIVGGPSTTPPAASPTTAPQPERSPDGAEPEPPPAPVGPAASFGDGTHVVGTDIQAGTYRTAGPVSQRIPELGICYWARLRDTTGDVGTIIANSVGKGPTTVTISPGDGAFKTSGCQPWSKTR